MTFLRGADGRACAAGAIVMALLFGSMSNVRADACWDQWRAKLNAVGAPNTRYVALLKTTGDCSYVEKIQEINKRYNAMLLAVPCANMHIHVEPLVASRARWMRFCKTKPNTQTAKSSDPDKKNAASPAAGPLIAPPPNVSSQSASCSTITGLGGDTSAAANCNTGNSLLAAARAVRTQNPKAAAETYRQAAEAYRRAGDVDLANQILQEALSLVASNTPMPQDAPPSVPQMTPQPSPPAQPEPPPNQAAIASPPGPPSPAPQAALPGDQAIAARSDGADSCPPAIPASYWQNGPNADYCAKASTSCWERGSALYGYLCMPDPRATADTPDAGLEERLRSKLKRIRRTYKPPISPQALTALAYTACRDKSLDDRRRCIDDAELALLLGADSVVQAACASIAESIARHNQAVDEGPGPDDLKEARRWVCAADPALRAECASIQDRQAQVDCVDAVYVRGPGAYGNGLRSTLQKSLNAN